jgi:hypothetical protein
MKSIALLLACTLLFTTRGLAQSTTGLDADDVDVSYIYAAVMGTGTYKINGRRITMLQLPLSYTQREMTAEQVGLVWTLPISLGYDAVTNHNWYGDLLDDDLVTLTALPGFEYHLPIDSTWRLKPFATLGLGHDFVAEENVWMGILGLSALGTWYLPENWELRWGGAFQVAGEYQQKSHHRTSFGLFETGIDGRWNTPLVLADRVVNTGAYYIFQYYIPEWDIDQLRPRESDIRVLNEFGLSAGLRRPIKFLGISFSRVRVGYNWGSGVRGWTFGTEFPF